MSLSVTQSFTFPSTQCHSLSHSPLPSHPHSVTLCDHTILQLPIHTVSLSAITLSCIFKKSIHTVSLSVVTQSSSHSHGFTLSSHSPLSFHSDCFTLSSHSPSSSHPHSVTLCHHTALHLPIHTVSLSVIKYIHIPIHTMSLSVITVLHLPIHKVSLSVIKHSFSHLHRVTVIKQVSSLPLSLSASVFLNYFLFALTLTLNTILSISHYNSHPQSSISISNEYHT